MATPAKKLANSLEALQKLQTEGRVAIRSRDISRTHRERLTQNGFLKEVMKGWYVPTRPDERTGESTSWYVAYWPFCAAYLNQLRGKDWCISPEQSLALHTENWAVPKQLLVRARKAQNNITALPHDTTLLDVRAELPNSKNIVVVNELRLFSVPAALVACSRQNFLLNSLDMRAALSMVRDASDVLQLLLEGEHSVIAGRLAGAFRNIGRDQIADEILNTMRSVGYDCREKDPFVATIPVLFSDRQISPIANRIRLMWQTMRGEVIDNFPSPPGLPNKPKQYLKDVEKIYGKDAYHSLSIEGYQVNADLIERVRSGIWNPDLMEGDRAQINALAARGYWQAYEAVRKSISRVLSKENSGTVASDDHRTWYREMFGPSVVAGLLRPSDLAGYRNAQVYIRQSMHVPPNQSSVRDAMPSFFELLEQEPHAGVRAVLGHFIFVYIHPYSDGNGRMGRFLMNVMLASGGYPWLIIPMEERDAYMNALESASVNQEITPFTEFLAGLFERNTRFVL